MNYAIKWPAAGFRQWATTGIQMSCRSVKKIQFSALSSRWKETYVQSMIIKRNIPWVSIVPVAVEKVEANEFISSLMLLLFRIILMRVCINLFVFSNYLESPTSALKS